jgi:ribosomal protein S18 acetylase RimI-like enzyme
VELGVDIARIREIEEAAARAWPAEERVEREGWVLRASAGVTRRANSVLPVGGNPEASLPALVRDVEAWYCARGLPVRFQMTPAAQPENLDEFLEGKGYVVTDRTQVQTVALASLSSLPPVTVDLSPDRSDLWEEVFAGAEELSPHAFRHRRRLLNRIPQPRAFAIASIRHEPIAVGLCAAEGPWAGLFGLATLPEWRRQGAGAAIVKALAQWSQAQGAREMYLQVREDNEPAQHFYRRLGFELAYHYHYRELDWP